MTKLLQWLLGVSLLGAVWALVAFDLLELSLPRTYREVAWPMPLYLLVSFGCYSLATVGYRVATFNDCNEAARELQEQIKEAKEDLRKKGPKPSGMKSSMAAYKCSKELQRHRTVLAVVRSTIHWQADRDRSSYILLIGDLTEHREAVMDQLLLENQNTTSSVTIPKHDATTTLFNHKESVFTGFTVMAVKLPWEWEENNDLSCSSENKIKEKNPETQRCECAERRTLVNKQHHEDQGTPQKAILLSSKMGVNSPSAAMTSTRSLRHSLPWWCKGLVIFTLHHVQHIPLCVHLRHLAQRVVRANNVQVVIELHLHGIVVPLKPAEGERKG
ncbi:hypothetical protein CCH79_00008683 [Gambusia affinis]|uniref:Dolichol-phosphate mannose synthase subunit 3 n=1 Tax=Gambusia affinis TaxID=33528 RepID=A0A315UTW7_GAMAF|nr:hypothetical protein CCH79_00008683 [Gambusia affinis]